MRLPVLAALLAGGLAVLSAQPQQPIRVGTNFVRVDAYPLRGGQPVFDLKAEEFEVFEDGVLQKIETFEHVVVRLRDRRPSASSPARSVSRCRRPRIQGIAYSLSFSILPLSPSRARTESTNR